MRKTVSAFSAGVLTLATLSVLSGSTQAQPQQAQPRQPGQVRIDPNTHVVIFGLDGTRADKLDSYAPFIDSLDDTGYWSTATLPYPPPTLSGPGWATNLTGVWADKHGIVNNDLTGNNLDEYPSFLDRLESLDGSASTYSATDWAPLGSAVDGGPIVQNPDEKFSIDDTSDTGDSRVADNAAGYIKDNAPNASFVYFGQVDEAGHDHGAASPQYAQALRRADGYVKQVVQSIQSRPNYPQEKWLFLVTTDHGMLDEGGHGGDSDVERTTFLTAEGTGVHKIRPPQEPKNTDVSVTALKWLGVPINPDWQLDGHSVFDE